MKFFHLSDLHIGLKLINRDLSEDQKYILCKIIEIAKTEKPDAVVIAGDIYDKAVPSAEAIEIFDGFVDGLSAALPDVEIMIISGNHDSAIRLNVFRGILKKQKIHMIGVPPETPEAFIEKVTLEDAFGRIHFYLLPFVKPSMVKSVVGVDENGNNLSYHDTIHRLIERESICQEERNVLVSHQFYLPGGKKAEEIERMDSEIRTVGNIDEISADILQKFDYAALGHIHKPMKVGNERYRYCGTPLACSVSEAGQEKGMIMVEMGKKGDVKTTVLPLVPLRQVMVIKGTLEEVLKQSCEDYVTVILTDQVDFDVIDMQARIRLAFPNLLEIRREVQRKADYSGNVSQEVQTDPFALCCSFLGDLDPEEKTLLQEVINTVKEVQ